MSMLNSLLLFPELNILQLILAPTPKSAILADAMESAAENLNCEICRVAVSEGFFQFLRISSWHIPSGAVVVPIALQGIATS